MIKTTRKPPDAPLDPLYTPAEACERLRCQRQTLSRLYDDGDITLLKIRGKTLVAGIEALITRQLEAAKRPRLKESADGCPPSPPDD